MKERGDADLLVRPAVTDQNFYRGRPLNLTFGTFACSLWSNTFTLYSNHTERENSQVRKGLLGGLGGAAGENAVSREVAITRALLNLLCIMPTG